MKDTIAIRGLSVETIIGHHQWERRLPRKLMLDIELSTDAGAAANSDELKDALDYDAVVRTTREFVESSRFTLIETLAAKLAEKLLKEFGTLRVKLTVHKPGAVWGAQSVSVTVERS